MHFFQLMRFPNFKLKALTFSYDDGVIFDKRLVEIFKKNNLKGTFNINSGLFGKGERMPKEDVLKLYDTNTCEVAVHGEKHLPPKNVDKSVFLKDIITDRVNLENLFGRIIKGSAYAYGSFDDEIVDIMEKCGINYARTVQSTHTFDIPENWLKLHPTCHHNDEKLMELAEKFLNFKPVERMLTNKPMMFYVWGHSYEFDRHNNWEVIEKFCEYVANRKDVWYATNGEIYDYVKAFESLSWSADGDSVFNPTNTVLYMVDNNGKEIILKPNEYKKI